LDRQAGRSAAVKPGAPPRSTAAGAGWMQWVLVWRAGHADRGGGGTVLNLADLLLKAGGPVLPLGRHIPFAVRKLAIEQAMRRLFGEPQHDGEFDVLEGRWLRIEVSDLGMAWCLTRDAV